MNEQEMKALCEQLKGLLPQIVDFKDVLGKAKVTEEDVKKVKEQLAGIDGNLTKLSKDVIDIGKRRIQVQPLALDPEAKMDFAKFFVLTNQMTRRPTEQGINEIRAIQNKYSLKVPGGMHEGTDDDGGYLVPEPFSAEIWRIAEQASVALTEARMSPLTRGYKLPVTSLSTGVSVAWTNEGTNFTQSNPKLAKVVVNAEKLAGYTQFTNELLEDEEAGLPDLIATIYGEAMGAEIDNQAFNGSGSPFTGILKTAGVNLVTLGTGTSFASFKDTNLSSMISQIKESVLSGSKFYMHRTVFHYVRTLKDFLGQPIYWPAYGTEPGTIYGYPYRIVEKMPAASSTTANTPFMLFGNMKNYIVGTRGTMEVVLTGEGKTLTIADEKILAVRRRVAMIAGLPAAFAVMKTGAAS